MKRYSIQKKTSSDGLYTTAAMVEDPEGKYCEFESFDIGDYATDCIADLEADIAKAFTTIAELNGIIDKLRAPNDAYPAAEYHEDHGCVLWWRFPLEEPPWAGSELDDDFTPDYYTHWSRLQAPTPVPERARNEPRTIYPGARDGLHLPLPAPECAQADSEKVEVKP